MRQIKKKGAAWLIVVSMLIGYIPPSMQVAQAADVPVQSVSFADDPVKIFTKDVIRKSAVVSPADATDKSLVYGSSDESVARVDSTGNVEGISSGTAVISATSSSVNTLGGSYTLNVLDSNTVISVPVDATVEESDVKSFTVNVTSNNPAHVEETIEYTSSDTTTVTTQAINNGRTIMVAGIRQGEVTITATLPISREIAQFKVKVVEAGVKSVSFKDTARTVFIGESLQQRATVLPAVATDTSVTYESANPLIASVDQDGNVKGLSEGTVIIRATSKSNPAISGSYTLSVLDSATVISGPVETYIDMNKDKILEFQVTSVNPVHKTKDIVFSVADSSIATIQAIDGRTVRVTGLKEGTTNIIASLDGTDITQMFLVTVVEIDVSGITFPQSELSMYTLDSVENKAIVHPSNATNPLVSYESSNPSVVQVNADGVVTGISEGTAVVTATSISSPSISGAYTVRVAESNTSIVVAPSITVIRNRVEVFPASITSNNPAHQTADIRYRVADTTIATAEAINNGRSFRVAGIDDGTTIIEAYLANGIKTEFSVTVEKEPTALTVTGPSVVTRGQVISADIGIFPTDAPEINQRILYTVDKPEIATVEAIDATGRRVRIGGVSAGIVRITAQIEGTPISKSFDVEVLPVYVNSVVFPEDSVLIVKGGEYTQVPSVFPSEADNKEVEYSSSNTQIASVDANGKVTGRNMGTVTITATAKDKSRAFDQYTVTVIRPDPESVQVDMSQFTVNRGNSLQLKPRVKVLPADALQNVTFASMNMSVATITAQGEVLAVAPGEAVIRIAVANTNIFTECKIIVPYILVDNISFAESTVIIEVGQQSTDYIPTVRPTTADNQSLIYTSSAPDIVFVNESTGEITASQKGTAVITATSRDGSNVSAQYTVRAVTNADITLDVTEKTLIEASLFKLTAFTHPDYVITTDVHFISSNPQVAKVNEATGLVSAISEGTAVITAISNENDAITSTCVITVIKQPVIDIQLPENSTILSLNHSYTLKPVVYPSNAGNKELRFLSGDNSIAQVSGNGTISAVGEGIATVAAITTDGTNISATFTVTVVNKRIQQVGFAEKSKTLAIGQGMNVPLSFVPADASIQTLKYTSSDPEVMIVDANGRVTALKTGYATLIGSTMDGSELTTFCNIYVNESVYIPVTNIELTTVSQKLKLGESFNMVPTVTPAGATDTRIVYESEDPSIATVDQNGLVYGVSGGIVNIIVKAVDGSGVQAVCQVDVSSEHATEVASINLDATSVSLMATKTHSIIATPMPTTAGDKKVVFSSSNANIATVNDNGVITGVAPGTAEITVTASDKGIVKARFTLTVTPFIPTMMRQIEINYGVDEDDNPLKYLTLDLEGSNYDDAWTYIYTIPEDASNSELLFKSSNPKVVTVDEAGSIESVGVGTAEILLTAADGSGVTATLVVKVVTEIGEEEPDVPDKPDPVVPEEETPVVNRNVLTLGYSNREVYVRKSFNVKAKAYTSTNTKLTIKYSSSNPRIAKVSSKGVVTGVRRGNVVLTVYTTGIRMTRKILVTVRQPVTSISVVRKVLTVKAGRRYRITSRYRVNPLNASNRRVTFTSSNRSRLIVYQNGIIYARKRGKVYIRVMSRDGTKKRGYIHFIVR